ncbi:MAG: carboxypeptidase regulatory-like domain-containing protein [Acidobacteria bacterium]|nr:carboxypeptidase regulatory-like domain-containing protein [Acidobacteriota bacterium]
MRQILFLLVAVLSVCLLDAEAQTVNESESTISFNGETALVALVVESPNKISGGRIGVELLDPAGRVRASAAASEDFAKGKKTYEIKMPAADLLKTAGDDLVWYRLHYRIEGERGNAVADGLVSLSELIRDVFELHIAAGENIYSGRRYRVSVRALRPLTKQPVENVKIEGGLKLDLDTDADDDKLELKAAGETDDDGFAVLDFELPAGKKLDEGHLKIVGRKNGIVREFENDDLSSRENKGSLFLTGDKPIYQPGQSFNVRALYFDAASTVVSGSALEFTIKDEGGLVLYRETVKTSDFGIAAISWKIPDNAKLGSYRVEVAGDDEIDGNSLEFKVSRYDLPQFGVSVKTDKTFYLPSENKAEVTVRADYLFGKPVTKGKVRVVEEAGRRWNWVAQKYDVEEKQSFEGATDAEGRYVVRVDLGPAQSNLIDNRWQHFEDLHFAAYFTDPTTNRTEQRRFDVRISKEPIHVYLTGRFYDLSRRLPSIAYVSTFYADGTPAVCDVEIGGRKAYSSDPFETVRRLRTNTLGAGKVEIPPLDTLVSDGNLDLKIRARDDKGQTGTDSQTVYYYGNRDGLRLETEKTIFKPGESVRIRLRSTIKNANVFLDVVKNWSVVESRFVRLDGDGRGEVKLPYDPNFTGELTLAAYLETDSENSYYRYYNLIRDSHGIIFPERQNLSLDAQFSAASYKPNEEASVKFSVLDSVGKAVESALGVVVFDKAVEERARTDADFGSYFSRFRGWLGYQKSFGGITLKDLNELDPSKPVSAEMQLAAEAMLADSYYYPNIYRSREWKSNPYSVYAEYFQKQIETLKNVLQKRYENDFAHPTDEDSLRRILAAGGVDFDALRDPWGNNYRVAFAVDKTEDVFTLTTAGSDKKFGTKDDSAVFRAGFAYFRATGQIVDAAVAEYHQKTGGFIRDLPTLKTELAARGVDLDRLKDRWNRDYRITFETDGRYYAVRFSSTGPNGYYEPYYWNRDDFDVWISRVDYFAETEAAINRIFSRTVNSGKRPFPGDDAEFKQLLKENGLDFSTIKDGDGRPVYLGFEKTPRYSDKTVVENGKQKITPVTEEVLTFHIRSSGVNQSVGGDDYDLATFTGVLSEQSKETKYLTKDVRALAFSGASGALRGTVSDAAGAVVPNVSVTATGEGGIDVSTKTKDDGTFLLENLTPGNYRVKIDAAGFKTLIYENIRIAAQTLVELRATLEAGAVSESVTVSADSVSVDTTESKMQTNITSQQINSLPKGTTFSSLLKVENARPERLSGGFQLDGASGAENVFIIDGQEYIKTPQGELVPLKGNSTPRLRQYFPETLVWSPEILTDKNGRAELKFKMADNITTWKLYTIASTKNGKIGVTEKEVAAFQPFFADLEPPRFLTDGDEIRLPVTIRNYTEQKQKVAVSMTESPWFRLFTAPKQQLEVASGESGNAVFGFRAIAPVNDGKQRVTAIAAKDSDAVEKPVTVRPNGEEVVRTESKFSRQNEIFDVDFPANALAKTPKAELKIYPNLFSHVTESVEGLLERPYGCGEQTTSSTYPNLMILKFVKEDSKLRPKAQRFLQKGYERLLGYQTADGGFSYWGGRDAADIALTAYVLRFLTDADGFVEVDRAVVERAENWLVRQQKPDGSWVRKYYWENAEDASRTKLFTAYVARTLAMRKNSDKTALGKALGYLRTRNAEIDEPYALALYGLAAFDTGDREEAAAVAERLEKMAISEGDSVYWKLETNTPFYGWGTPGRIETTALVLQLLIKTGKPQATNDGLISKATMFLLKNKDRYGVWYSTQTTVNVLDAFLAALADAKTTAATDSIQVMLNGAEFQTIAVSSDRIEPVVLDLSEKLTASANRVEVRSASNAALMSQLVASHYIDWKDSDVSNRNVNQSRAIRLDYKCDRQTAAVMEEINCSVEAERVGFRGYGMLLAEIGLPPGADVSRESLQAAMDADWSLTRYDILPDRIVLYMWSKAGGTKFNFKFKPRYGIDAQTPPSTVYDYYNEEAKATLAPQRFTIK